MHLPVPRLLAGLSYGIPPTDPLACACGGSPRVRAAGDDPDPVERALLHLFVEAEPEQDPRRLGRRSPGVDRQQPVVEVAEAVGSPTRRPLSSVGGRSERRLSVLLMLGGREAAFGWRRLSRVVPGGDNAIYHLAGALTGATEPTAQPAPARRRDGHAGRRRRRGQ